MGFGVSNPSYTIHYITKKEKQESIIPTKERKINHHLTQNTEHHDNTTDPQRPQLHSLIYKNENQ